MRVCLAIQGGVVAVIASLLFTNCRSKSPSVRHSRAISPYPDNYVVAAYKAPLRPPVVVVSSRTDQGSYWEGDDTHGPASITIDLSEQKAMFFKGEKLVGVSAISTGREGYDTPPGSFKISEKDVDHRSSLYGDFVDEAGNIIVSNVDTSKDNAPPETIFRGAPMRNFMRISGGIGMHAGHLPGYPASHGCIRMPEFMSEKFYENVEHGTSVLVTR